MRNKVLTVLLAAMAWLVAAGTPLAQDTNAQLLALISSQLPSGLSTPISNFRTVLAAMVNSTNVSGTSCPSTALSAYQPWANTTGSPTGVVLNVFDGANCVPWALLNTSTHQLTLAGSASQAPGRNLAARFGSMDVWQRGAGASAAIALLASTMAYTVDGCYLSTGANEASTVTSVAGIATGSSRAAQVQRNSSQTGSATMTFGCPLDSDEIALARGNFVVFSHTIQAGSNWSPPSGSITANVLCGTGSPVKQTVGYSGQTTVASLSTALTPGGAAARLQVTSGAVVPSNCTQMEVQWTWSPSGTAGANDFVTIDDVQLEVGAGPLAVATPFMAQDFSVQLALARRHYAKTFPYGTAPAQGPATGLPGALLIVDNVIATTSLGQWRFPQQMRVNPNVTTYNPTQANANCRDVSGTPADRIASVDPDTAISTDQVIISCAAGGSAGDHVYVHATADSGI